MLVGHTKFSTDRIFGLIKKTYRLSTISTINELERVVRRSSVEQTIPQLIRDIFGVLQVTFLIFLSTTAFMHLVITLAFFLSGSSLIVLKCN